MDFLIVVPTRRTVVTSRTTMRATFECKHCGFTSATRVVGVGSASTHSQIGVGPGPAASAREHVQAREQSVADAKEILSLAPCPQCGQRGSEAWAAYTRQTRILQAIVAAVLLVIVYAMWDKENPALAVIGLIPTVALVFVTGYLRGLRAELPADRVTFLSPQELAAEDAAAALERKPKKKRRRTEETPLEPRDDD
jgi:predicted RNA-binding Zn-ribbon protein involved in translation (DUF1610 family)